MSAPSIDRRSVAALAAVTMFALAAPYAVGARPPANAAAPSAAQVRELERQAAESRARAAALATRSAKIEQELEAQRQALTQAAAEVRAGEETLSRLDGEQAALAKTLGRGAEILAADRARLSRLTAGLVRLAQMPPGGLFASFDSPVDAARARILLRSALVATHDGAKQVETELTRLDDASRQLEAKRREGEREAALLKTRQANLTGLIDRRQSLYQQTDADRRAEEEKAQKIADEARDLRELVAGIEARQKAEAAAAAEAQRKARRKAPASTKGSDQFAAAKGLPVNGEIKIRFGQNDGLGTTSHGVTVIARPGAIVTSPSSGTVRFAGPFRSYREILILEHPGGYLSLIAGLARVSVTLGASVAAGEPIGAMDERADARPELYYELRRKGEFVDPEAVSLPVAVKGKAR